MRKDEAKSILLKTIPCLYKDNEKICHHLQEGGGDCESCYEEALDTILDLVEKQQKEIKDWFEIADNILRATNDYGNITIGDIPKYIKKQQKEIEELKKPKYIIDCKTNKITELTNDFISKDKIREKLKKLRREEDKIYKLNYELEPVKAIDSLLLRIGDLEKLLKEN